MASGETIQNCVTLLFAAPLANKPDGDTAVKNTIKVFTATLADVDDALLRAAVVHHIATNKWFPAVADLRQTAVSLIHLADDTPDAYTGWQQIMRVHDYYGKWNIPAAESELHPMVLRAINSLGGLAQFFRCDADEVISWRARFVSAYDQQRQRQADSAMMLPDVAGYVEQRKELGGQSVAGAIGQLADGMRINL